MKAADLYRLLGLALWRDTMELCLPDDAAVVVCCQHDLCLVTVCHGDGGYALAENMPIDDAETLIFALAGCGAPVSYEGAE